MFSSAEEVWKNAKHNGVTFKVDVDSEKLIASPRSRVTEELAEGIREYREPLMKRAYIIDVLSYLNKHYVEGADDEVFNDIDAIRHAAEMPLNFRAMRAIVRERAKAVLKHFRQAKARKEQG